MHDASLGIDASRVKAHMPYIIWQSCLMTTDARRALSGNVEWLLRNTAHDSQPKLAKQAKLDQKTVGRMLNNSNAATLDSIQALAVALKIEPWQLLAPRFGEGLHTVKNGTSIVPVARPAVEAKAPSASKDSLGIPHFRPPEVPVSEPAAVKGPRAGKRSSDSQPKRGARVAR